MARCISATCSLLVSPLGCVRDCVCAVCTLCRVDAELLALYGAVKDHKHVCNEYSQQNATDTTTTH